MVNIVIVIFEHISMCKVATVILFLLLIPAKVLFSQEELVYIDYQLPTSVKQLNSLRNLKNTKSIHFNHPPNTNQFADHLKKISQLVELEKVVISNYEGKKLPSEVQKLEFVEEISIIGCPEVSMKVLFKQLSVLPILERLNLSNNNIVVLPKEIQLLANLKELNISLNSNINLKASLDVIKEIKMIQKLGLPVNQLSEIPPNIGELKNLKELNLFDNNLTDLPDEIADLDSLEILKVEKNIIVKSLDNYKKFGKLNIKYLSIDDNLSDEEFEKLKQIFPNAEIEQIEEKQFGEDQFKDELKLLKDSLYREVMNEREGGNGSLDSPKVIRKVPKGVKILSKSYMHYAEIFDNLSVEVDFDSTLFQERFRDTNYYNVFPIQPGIAFEKVNLKMVKSKEKGQIWFEFIEDEYYFENHPEMDAFNDMVWVVVGNIGAVKSFKEEYVKDKSYSDFRLQYRSGKKNFILVLKSGRGFEKLTVFPRFPSKSSSVEKVQFSYEKRMLKYLEKLNKRNYEYNKELFRKKANYRYQLARVYKKAWEDFKKNYFCEEEKEMSKEEWLSYYDGVVADEINALRRSAPRKEFLVRTLELLKYKQLKDVSEVKKEQGTKIGLFLFLDQDNKQMGITDLLVINKSLNNYKIYEGSKGVMEFYLFLRESDQYSVIALLRNGDVAITDRIDFLKVKFSREKIDQISMKRIDRELLDINLILKKAAL